MVAKKKSKKSKKVTSLVEFRAWLEGVEEMQGADWVPTQEQWTRIREKIDSIEDAPPAPAPVTEPDPVPHVPLSPYPSAPGIPGPSAFETVTRPAPAMNLSPDAPIAAGQQQVKTPDIDTSKGDYKSSFE
jgi:hypothetical protein